MNIKREQFVMQEKYPKHTTTRKKHLVKDQLSQESECEGNNSIRKK